MGENLKLIANWVELPRVGPYLFTRMKGCGVVVVGCSEDYRTFTKSERNVSMPIAQFSGLASGLDTAALIDALIEARSVRNKIRKSQLPFLQSENSALSQFNLRLLGIESIVHTFRTINGGDISRVAVSNNPDAVRAIADS